MTNESNFIKELIQEFKKEFPGVPYLYQKVRDTHFFRVFFVDNKTPERFVFFSLEMYDKFSDLNINDFLCITEEETLVDLDDPSQFTLNSNIEQISTKELYSDNNQTLDNNDTSQITLAA